MATVLFFGVDIGLVILAIAVIIFSVVISRIVYALLRRWLDERLESLGSSKMISRAVEYLILFVGLFYGLVLVLGPLGLSFNEVAASLGIIGVAVAFASQQVVQNVIAGILIALERPIRLEDWIEIGDTGLTKVKDINLTNTVLRSSDGRIFVIPNSNILGSRITNYTRSALVEVKLKLEIPIGVDYTAVKNLILKIIEANKRILPVVPKEEESIFRKIVQLPHVRRLLDLSGDVSRFQPQVLITSINPSSIALDVHIWIREFEKKDLIVSEVMEEILHGLKDMNIKPQ